MNKVLTLLTGLFVFLILPSVVFAASGDLSVKISQPKTPTNQNSFNVNFVTLDLQDRPVTVKCFKQGPSDGSFTQFGPDYFLIAGGNSDNCVVNSSVVNGDGIYQFFVTATAGSDSVTSNIVTVEYKTTAPGTPTNYQKEQTSSCNFKIKFKTADDGGKTVKVVFYRSDSTNFVTNSSTQFATLFIGSNTEGELNTTLPDCFKTYYFALRAFDNAGNGSGVIGDPITISSTTTTSSNQTVNVAPAVVISGTIGGQILGAQSGTQTSPTPTNAQTGEVNNQSPIVAGDSTSRFWENPTFLFIVLALILLKVGYDFYQKKR